MTGERSTELRRWLAVGRRRWWLLALGLVLGGGATFAVSRLQTPMYQATATLLVNQSQAPSGLSYNDVLANQQLSKTYSELVTSGPVLDQAGERFDLSYDELAAMVSGSVRRDTQLIDVRVRGTDPDLAAALANEVANVFAAQIRRAQLGQQLTVEEDLQRQITAAQASIDEKQQAILRLSAAQPGLPEAQRQQQLADAQSQAESLRQNQATLTRRLQELRIDLARSVNSVTLANPARVPEKPVSPRLLLNTALGALLGLATLAGLVAVREHLDDTVKSADDVARATGVATLGAVAPFAPSKGKGVRKHTLSPRLITSLDGDAPIAEAYRMVRVNLEFARANQPNHTMLITSALPGEGKSTTASNLAVMLAQSGRRVILVDADLRKRSLHTIFALPNASGLSTLFVMDEPRLQGLLRPTAIDNLLLLTSGPMPPNPTELLSSPRMVEILSRLAAESDIVVIDSPPLLSVADSAALASLVDGVVLVVDAGRTRLAALSLSVEALERAGARIWGVVLNKLHAGSAGQYYGYYGYRFARPPEEGPHDPSSTGDTLGSQPEAGRANTSIVTRLNAMLKRRSVTESAAVDVRQSQDPV